jgi:hypothetical protein
MIGRRKPKKEIFSQQNAPQADTYNVMVQYVNVNATLFKPRFSVRKMNALADPITDLIRGVTLFRNVLYAMIASTTYV